MSTPDVNQLVVEAGQYIRKEPSAIDRLIFELDDMAMVAGSAEHLRVVSLKGILSDYAQRTKASRPMCLAVFGPPGSGKSTIVKKILKTAGNQFSKAIEINLSQFSQVSDVQVLPRVGDTGIPVFFFDEFDTPLNERRLGWLKAFLSLMQDGYFGMAPDRPDLRRSVLVFAGGTAETMAEFQSAASQDEQFYRQAKVPDFISRLHGYLDVGGINGPREDRIIRRALALRFQLSSRGMAKVDLDADLLRDLLVSSHFVHHQRSLQSLVDVSMLGGKSIFNGDCLPGMPDSDECDNLLRLHISRGPLDGKLIGISTGKQDARHFHVALTRELFMRGANIAYGGDLDDSGVLAGLIDAAKDVPEGLLKRKTAAIRNYLGYPSYLGSPVKQQIASREKTDKDWIEFIKLQSLSDEELKHFRLDKGDYFKALPDKATDPYDVGRHMAWSISLFRMRLRMIQDLSALVVIGGKAVKSGSWGRGSGIAEEVMIAQALGKPVYVLGGAQLAAQSIGYLLGLGDTVLYGPTLAQDPPGAGYQERSYPVALTTTFADCFQLPGKDRAPLTEDEILNSFKENAVGSKGWTYNGLTVAENRRLFAMDPTSDQDQMIKMISEAIQRV